MAYTGPRRINFIGGPGVGKSCTAAWIFSMCKFRHLNCEYVPEFVKSWAYEGRTIKSFAQHHIFGNQLYAEDTMLSAGVDFIVSDSPIFLSACYGRKMSAPSWETILIESKVFEQNFPSININLVRSPQQPYQPLGRFQTKEEAYRMDSDITSLLGAYDIPFVSMDAYDPDPFKFTQKMAILDYVLAKAKGA